MSAIEQSRLSAVLGYELVKGTEGVTSGYLPQRLAIVAEANTTKQVTMPTFLNATSAQEVAEAFGNGSPAHLSALNLDLNGVMGKIPTIFYSVEEAAGATAQSFEVGVTGTPSKSATQYIRVGGKRVSFTVASTDVAADIVVKIKAAIEADYNSPVLAGTIATTLPLTAKWAGQSGIGIRVEFDQDTDIGLTYTSVRTNGAGEKLPTDALALFGSSWNTVAVNCLSNTSTILNEYELFVGTSTDKTGRYNAEDWKPCVVVSGTEESDKAALIAITDARKLQQANVVVPCGNSLSIPLEIASAAAGRYALLANSDPKTDLIGTSLIGVVPPVDGVVGDLSAYDNRDFVVKGGCSTTKLNAGLYEMIDFVTTYHPDGENPAQFRYVRNLVGIDFNVKFAVRFNEQIFLAGKTILPDSSGSTTQGVIKPKQWKGILNDNVFKPFAEGGLFSDAEYSLEGCVVGINPTNGDRLDTEFPYKRTGTARISSVSGIANFELG
jgi:phage tail sheath gpL-like